MLRHPGACQVRASFCYIRVQSLLYVYISLLFTLYIYIYILVTSGKALRRMALVILLYIHPTGYIVVSRHWIYRKYEDAGYVEVLGQDDRYLVA